MLCDEPSECAQKIGAVNTILFKDGKVFGENSDSYGFMESLVSRETISFEGKKALVLGAGGASRAIIFELKEKGAEVTICNRTTERADTLAKQFHCKVADWQALQNLSDYDILVNTTSLGMENQPELQIDLSSLPKTALVTDIVYNPLQTELLKQAEGMGLKTVDGLGMLLHQAVLGFNSWFGVKPQVTAELREHIIKALQARETKWALKEGI
jgi:shikimate dehydrogenase